MEETMKNRTLQNRSRPITLLRAKEMLIEDIREKMGVTIQPRSGYDASVDMFLDFMHKKGIRKLPQLTESSLVLFRFHIVIHWGSDIDAAVTSAAGSLLAMAVAKGLIEKDLYLFWESIEDVKDFETIINSKKEEI
jgi:hypothetical protein